jgi:hypothetical protein
MGNIDGFPACRKDSVRGQMSAVYEDGRCRADQFLIDVLGIERHVGAIFSVEEQGKPFSIPDSKDHKRSEAMRVRMNCACVDAFANELLPYEAAHVIGPDARQKGRSKAETSKADGRVRGATAHVLRERRHILETPADLLAIQVNARAADRNEVQRFRQESPRTRLSLHETGILDHDILQ